MFICIRSRLGIRKICNEYQYKIFSTVSTNKNAKKSREDTGNFSANYCAKLVQTSDRENYLCTLLLNDECRRSAFALRAFNVEISKIMPSVSEEQVGKMKLQFWSDSIDKCFDNKQTYLTDHPVLKELKMIIDHKKLTKTFFKRLIKSRDRPLNKLFSTQKEMEDYAEHSVSSLYYLLLEIIGVKNMNIDHALSHLGKAQGIVNLLRAIPLKKRSEAVNIPQEILLKYGVSEERIMRDAKNDKGVEDCIFDVATIAHQHLEKSRKLANHIPKNIREILLPAVAVQRYLDRLRKANFRLTNQDLFKRDHLLPVAFYWHRFKSKY